MNALQDVSLKLERAAADLASKVAGGSCSSHEEYRHMTGRIRGLQDAQSIVQIVKQSIDVDPDDPSEELGDLQ